MPDILAFYESEEGQREFAEWKERREGSKREAKRNKYEKGGRTVVTAAPALFAFMGSVSSSGDLSVSRWASAPLRFGSGCFRIGQRKPIIRTYLLSEKGSDYMGLVPVAGLEPARHRWQWILSPPRLPIPTHRQKHVEYSTQLRRMQGASAGIFHSFYRNPLTRRFRSRIRGLGLS